MFDIATYDSTNYIEVNRKLYAMYQREKEREEKERECL